MSKRKSSLGWAAAVIFFLAALYLAESPVAGSQAVAAHNGGYGTFDMNSYDEGVVEEVLSGTDEGGLSAYNLYYVTDFVFIIAFGLLQLKISRAVFPPERKALRALGLGLPVLRGLLDSAENILLLYIINRYPLLFPQLVGVSSVITTLKFACMAAWVVLILAGLVISAIKRHRQMAV